MAKTKDLKCFVVDMRHSMTSQPEFVVATTYDKAVEIAHEFFLSHTFEIKEGKAFDGGNDDGNTGGFDCFDSVEYHDGKVAEFIHFHGDGPYCSIEESKLVS